MLTSWRLRCQSERQGVIHRPTAGGLNDDFPNWRSEAGCEPERQQPCRTSGGPRDDRELLRPGGQRGQIGSVNYLWVGVAMSYQGDQQAGDASARSVGGRRGMEQEQEEAVHG